ncbi:MAG: dihydroorotase, partial [Actinomycetia bacterium]|nr:dihydroorotase [Actinomycetes bacterium]
TVMAGLVDMHVHLRDPGSEEKETIESGARAALAGGITSMVCMPNTSPVLDSPSLIKYVMDRGKDTGCNIYPVAAMTVGLEGKNMTEMCLLSEMGAVGFSDDGKAVADARLMFEIMRYSVQFGRPLILHEEVRSFSRYGVMHEGKYSTRLGLEGISSLSDDLMIGRDIVLAGISGAKIHITHISTRGAADMIRKAKKEGIDITCDVTAHHLFFNDSYLESFDTNLKVKPPIRSREDQEALIEGVADGTIDAIVSDHAPHLDTEKNTTFKLAEFGTTGLETLFGASYSILCRERKLSLDKVIGLLTEGPSKIAGIDGGSIKKGARADIAVADCKAGYTVKKEDFRSRSKNSAFIGQKLYGKILYTISNGKIVYESGLN